MTYKAMCPECGGLYDSEWKVRYCRKADLDPRKENERFRSGLQRAVVLPEGWGGQSGESWEG
jgi:hypothetical protein